MQLLPIEIDEAKNNRFRSNPECVDILNIYTLFYQRVGFHKPWIGYFIANEESIIVGCGGFKGKPQNGKVEIAYGTFKNYEGKGLGKEICRQLVQLSLQTDPSLMITARTIAPDNASTHILTHNSFACAGTVDDEEDGEVWEWVYKPPPTFS